MPVPDVRARRKIKSAGDVARAPRNYLRLTPPNAPGLTPGGPEKVPETQLSSAGRQGPAVIGVLQPFSYPCLRQTIRNLLRGAQVIPVFIGTFAPLWGRASRPAAAKRSTSSRLASRRGVSARAQPRRPSGVKAQRLFIFKETPDGCYDLQRSILVPHVFSTGSGREPRWLSPSAASGLARRVGSADDTASSYRLSR